MTSKRIKRDSSHEAYFLYFQDLMRRGQYLVSPSEFSVLCFIYDRTWGWSKMWDRISYGQFSTGIVDSRGHWWHRGTGLSRSSVIRALKGLEDKKLIETKRVGNGRAYSIASHFAPLELVVSPHTSTTT